MGKLEINPTVWKYTDMSKHKVFEDDFIYWIIRQRWTFRFLNHYQGELIFKWNEKIGKF